MIAILVVTVIISVVIMMVYAVYCLSHFDKKYNWYDKVCLIVSSYTLIIFLFLLLTTSYEVL